MTLSSEQQVLALIGPTAVGKTRLSIEIAQRLDGEIVSADSRQIYRQLAIGTAKPSRTERARIPHHFIDELDLAEPFSAGRFADEASVQIEQIIARGRVPIVVGGSTLYIEALLHGLSDIPETSAETRKRLMQRLVEEGPDILFNELVAVDPESAATMDETKTQRIVRALEVYYDTGHPLSWYHSQRTAPPFPFVPVVLNRTRENLYARINRRVDRMLSEGLIEENRDLLESGWDCRHNPLRTIGYREPMAYIRGEVSYNEMVRLLKRNSRRYAKKQITWFRRHSEYTWLMLDQISDPLDRVTRLL